MFLTEEYGRAVLFYCVKDLSFFKKVWSVLDADKFASQENKLVYSIIDYLVRNDNKPGSLDTLKQQCKDLVYKQSLSFRDLQTMDAFIEWTKTSKDLVDKKEMLKTILPQIKDQVQHDIAMDVMQIVKTKKDLTSIIPRIQKLNSLSNTNLSGLVMTLDDVEPQLETLRGIQGLTTGVIDLDVALGGYGMARGQLGVILGASGDGKSMFLSNLYANLMRKNVFVGAVSLELQASHWMARTLANLSTIKINDIIHNPESSVKAIELAKTITTKPVLFAEMEPGSYVQDMIEWVDEAESIYKQKMEVLIVDYADRMGYTADGDYKGMEEVYEGLRKFADRRDMWVWTACQAKRQESRKILTKDDVADSINKTRVSDLVISINKEKQETDEPQVKFYICKYRTGNDDILVGPVPINFEYGRIG